MAALRTKVIQNDFGEGMSRDVAPALISPNGVYDLVDALLDEDANPYKRGGTANKSNADFGSSGLRWGWDGTLLPGPRTVFANDSDFGVLGEDDESPVNLGGAGLTLPKQSAVLEDLLFIGGGAIYGGSRKTAAYTTGTVTVTETSKTVTGSGTTWNTLVDPGMLLHVGNGRVYVVASVDSTTQITLRDAYEGESGGSKAYSLSPLYTVGSDPYETWDFLTVCANRVVLAFGNQIKFTEVDDPHTFKNFLGTTNEHTLPEGIQIVGLSTIGQTVLIFTTQGIWTLDGLAVAIVDQNGNAQHRIQQLSSGTILAGASGLAGAEQQLVVPCADGIYLMDGISSPTRISRPIDRLYRQRIEDGYRIGGAKVFRSHYFLPIVTGAGAVKELFVCRLDRPTRSEDGTVFPWTRFSGDGGQIVSYFVRSTVDPREPLLFGTQARSPSRVVDCSHYFEPDTLHIADADGSTFNFELVTRDIETGEETINVVRMLKSLYELIGGDGGSIEAFYSDGSHHSTGAKFGEAVFGTAKFGTGGTSFIPLTPITPVGESEGHDPARFRVNKRFRHVRFRIQSAGQMANFVLRSLELLIRPSGATRR